MLKAKVAAPYQKAWSVCDPVSWPTSAGSTGMIRPIEIMSTRAVIMMNGMAAARSRREVWKKANRERLRVMRARYPIAAQRAADRNWRQNCTTVIARPMSTTARRTQACGTRCE